MRCSFYLKIGKQKIEIVKKRCLFFILSAMLYIHGYSQNYITGNIFNSEVIGIFGDVNIDNANIKNSSGTIQISTHNQSNKIDVTNSNIAGVINIEGNHNSSINLSNKCKFGGLRLNKENNSDLDLFGDTLVISEKMLLENGRIWNNETIFEYDNTDPTSISFNDHSYIIGDFYFRTLKDLEYSIPIGDQEDLHLLKFKDNNSTHNLIKSCFCKGLPLELTGSTSQYSNHGYWALLASNETNCTFQHYFKPMNLSLLSKPSILQQIEKGINDFEEIIHPAINIDYNDSWFTIYARITTDNSNLIIIENKEQVSDEWINFISLSSGNDTHFIIPNLDSRYSTIKISIYNNWGNRIFKSENYRNEFDAKEYPEGTYYYQAVYKLIDDSQENVKNGFFEIKN